MMHPKTMLNIFFGRNPVENLAAQNIMLKEGLVDYAVAFLVSTVFIAAEVILTRVFLGFFNGENIVEIALTFVLMIIGLLILVPILYIFEVIFIYIFGALQFMVASFFKRERGDLNGFIGGYLSVMSSVKITVGLLLLIPLIGWIAAFVAIVYSIALTYRYVRERFRFTDAESAIVVLIPTNLVMGALLVIATAASFLLIGTRI